MVELNDSINFSKIVSIEGRCIGPEKPCYIIAEAGVNHFGDIGKAFALVDVAVDAGADAFKTQHFKTHELVSGDAADWRERLRAKELADEDILRIRDYCSEKGITFLCTAHDEISLELLYNEGVPAFKIGSGEVENWAFIEKIARYDIPVILSVGMYTQQQVHKVVDVFQNAKNTKLAILHCHTGYPSQPEDINLSVMHRIRDFFCGPVGYSDHTVGTVVPLAAVALGADILEKHITIDKNIPNAHDWIVSCDPEQLKQFVRDVRSVEAAVGNGVKEVTELERKSLLWARKSLVSRCFIPQGVRITREMIIAKRPGTGISPENLDAVIGRRVKLEIKQDSLIREENLS